MRIKTRLGVLNGYFFNDSNHTIDLVNLRRHYKGNIYEILDVVPKYDSGDSLVIFKDMTIPKSHALEEKKFYEKMDAGVLTKYGNVNKYLRMEMITEEDLEDYIVNQ